MKVFERVKTIRERKRISQNAIAYKLDLDQSQYSRRENGRVPFSAAEIEEIAAVLEINISELYGEATATFNNHDQNGGAFGQYITVPDKLIEQYEKRIEEKETIISLLNEQIEILKKK